MKRIETPLSGTVASRLIRTASRSGSATSPPAELLLVALDDVLSAHVCRVRIATRLTKRTALAEQVPALVERDLDRLEPATVLIRRGAGGLALPQVVLFSNELL